MDTTLFSQSDWEAILELRHTLHANPELSGEEQETKKRLMDFISHHTHLQLVDRDSWFYALYEPKKRNGKPAIGFRADMDALPLPEARDLPYGSTYACVAHICCHKRHSTALASLALLLVKDENILRPVYLIFQSAEESGKGGKSCAVVVEAAGLGEVYAFHNLSGYPENAIMVRDGLTQCASKGLTFRFTGKRAHAGDPEEGNNHAPALAKLTLLAQDLVRKVTTDPLKTLLLTLVGLNVGGKDFGISPGEGEISFTLRADEKKDLAELEQGLRRKADQLAAEYGLRRTVTAADPFPATVNHKECAEKVRRAARDLGLTLVPMEKPWRPSEDFGWYLKVCPGALFYVGNGENWPAPHHPAYDFNDRILPTPAALFLKLAED